MTRPSGRQPPERERLLRPACRLPGLRLADAHPLREPPHPCEADRLDPLAESKHIAPSDLSSR
jgi:hypothetical protein